MSLLEVAADARPDEAEQPRPQTSQLRSYAEFAAVLLAMVVWGRLVTGRTGGRDAGALVWGSLSLLPALLLLRPPLRHLLPLGALVVGSLVVCLTTPYAFSQAQWVSVAAYSGAAFAVVRTFASTPERRRAVACMLALVSLDQFAQGFLAWWGGLDIYRPMLGTFYWHNQFGAFMLPGFLLGSALAVYGHRVERVIGFICAPACAAGLLYSASRASMLVAGLGLIGLVLSAAVAADRRPRLRDCAVVVVASFASLFFFSSPLLFPHQKNPFGTDPVRAQQALATSAGDRLDFWHEAIAVTLDRPVTGGGFGSFAELSTTHLPVAAGRTTFAHDGLLQAFASGGVVWGLPVLACVLGLGVAAIRRGLGQLRRLGPDRAVAVGGSITVLALLLHAFVDFDWTYPALVISLATAGGLVLAVPRVARPASASSARARWAGVAVATAGLALGTQIAHAHDRADAAVVQAHLAVFHHDPGAAAAALRGARSWFYDPRLDVELLAAGLAQGDGAPLTLPEGTLLPALDRIGSLAAVDEDANARRAAVLLRLGRAGEALSSLRVMALARAHQHVPSLRPYARLLAVAGRGAEASDLLAGTIVLRGPEAHANPKLGLELFTLYVVLHDISPGSRDLRCSGSALAGLDLTQPDFSVPVLASATPADHCASLREKGWP